MLYFKIASKFNANREKTKQRHTLPNEADLRGFILHCFCVETPSPTCVPKVTLQIAFFLQAIIKCNYATYLIRICTSSPSVTKFTITMWVIVGKTPSLPPCAHIIKLMAKPIKLCPELLSPTYQRVNHKFRVTWLKMSTWNILPTLWALKNIQ